MPRPHGRADDPHPRHDQHEIPALQVLVRARHDLGLRRRRSEGAPSARRTVGVRRPTAPRDRAHRASKLPGEHRHDSGCVWSSTGQRLGPWVEGADVSHRGPPESHGEDAEPARRDGEDEGAERRCTHRRAGEQDHQHADHAGDTDHQRDDEVRPDAGLGPPVWMRRRQPGRPRHRPAWRLPATTRAGSGITLSTITAAVRSTAFTDAARRVPGKQACPFGWPARRRVSRCAAAERLRHSRHPFTGGWLGPRTGSRRR